ncbi:MAG: glycoside hydrolase family 57 protein [Deltaproteobacteria bacterium]|nr:glycoside hydrolase family 57 protein [Deltaproteobacteria bacterium]
MPKPLNIAILWHMHQPYYKDLVTGEYVMPWVRLHGIKDYYDMVAILDEFPSVHQTFNMVPSLVDQILDYVDNNATDSHLDLTLKPAAELTPSDKEAILQNFFLANWENMIKPYPRYWEILRTRGFVYSKDDLKEIQRYFTTQDYLDLQVLFNLAWFDPIFKDHDKFLRGLVKKGRDFTEEEKVELIKKQREVLALIIPKYKEMEERGIIEISTTPYYHPILPLLCDSFAAKMAIPNIQLPKRRFLHPEDAVAQVNKAVEFHKRVFGRAPRGMWPSEGSVSEEIIPIIADAGIKWIATDEEILAKSVHALFERDKDEVVTDAKTLYRSYNAHSGGKGVSMFFRDHSLSDLVGFVYSKWDADHASQDFINRLHRIRERLLTQGSLDEFVVPIILDGENAWEYYKNDGRDFLRSLYGKLSHDPLIKTVTMSEYLEANPPKMTIPHLFSGSWINHNFRIWIGHEEDNAAWDLLEETRRTLVEFEGEGTADKSTLEKAWEEIYIAEGSDWCWWYGDEHSTENDADFDNLFRKHLMNVYMLMGKDIPEELFIPILREDKVCKPTIDLISFISPTIDGEVSSYFEWLSAAYYDVTKVGGTMHRVESIVSHIYYGFNLANMYIRLDANLNLIGEGKDGFVYTVNILKPKPHKIEIHCSRKDEGFIYEGLLFTEVDGKWVRQKPLAKLAIKDIIEMEIPFADIGVSMKDQLQLFVTVKKNGTELEKWPHRGCIMFEAPTEDFEAIMWRV